MKETPDHADAAAPSSAEAAPFPKVSLPRVARRLVNVLRLSSLARRRRTSTPEDTWLESMPGNAEDAFVRQVLGCVPLMKHVFGLLQPFFACGSVQDGGDEQVVNGSLAANAVHRVKVATARTAWKYLGEPLKLEVQKVRHRHEALQAQFNATRREYLKEVSSLRSEHRVRGDPESILGRDVTFFFEPMNTLTPDELAYATSVVSEKLKMILETNPKVSATVDFGQVEKFRDIVLTSELDKVREALARKAHELTELREDRRRLQRELAQTSMVARANGDGSEAGNSMAGAAVMANLEERLGQLQEEQRSLELALNAQKHRAEAVTLERDKLKGDVCKITKEHQATLVELDHSRSELCSTQRELQVACVRGSEQMEKVKSLTIHGQQLTEANAALREALEKWRGRRGIALEKMETQLKSPLYENLSPLLLDHELPPGGKERPPLPEVSEEPPPLSTTSAPAAEVQALPSATPTPAPTPSLGASVWNGGTCALSGSAEPVQPPGQPSVQQSELPALQLSPVSADAARGAAKAAAAGTEVRGDGMAAGQLLAEVPCSSAEPVQPPAGPPAMQPPTASRGEARCAVGAAAAGTEVRGGGVAAAQMPAEVPSSSAEPVQPPAHPPAMQPPSASTGEARSGAGAAAARGAAEAAAAGIKARDGGMVVAQMPAEVPSGSAEPAQPPAMQPLSAAAAAAAAAAVPMAARAADAARGAVAAGAPVLAEAEPLPLPAISEWPLLEDERPTLANVEDQARQTAAQKSLRQTLAVEALGNGAQAPFNSPRGDQCDNGDDEQADLGGSDAMLGHTPVSAHRPDSHAELISPVCLVPDPWRAKILAAVPSRGSWAKLWCQAGRTTRSRVMAEEFAGLLRNDAKISVRDLPDHAIQVTFEAADVDKAGSLSFAQFTSWLGISEEDQGISHGHTRAWTTDACGAGAKCVQRIHALLVKLHDGMKGREVSPDVASSMFRELDEEIAGVCAFNEQVTNKLKQYSAQTTEVREVVNKLNSETQQAAEILRQSSALATDISLQDCLAKVQGVQRATDTTCASIYGRLWSDTQERQGRIPRGCGKLRATVAHMGDDWRVSSPKPPSPPPTAEPQRALMSTALAERFPMTPGRPPQGTEPEAKATSADFLVACSDTGQAAPESPGQRSRRRRTTAAAAIAANANAGELAPLAPMQAPGSPRGRVHRSLASPRGVAHRLASCLTPQPTLPGAPLLISSISRSCSPAPQERLPPCPQPLELTSAPSPASAPAQRAAENVRLRSDVVLLPPRTPTPSNGMRPARPRTANLYRAKCSPRPISATSLVRPLSGQGPRDAAAWNISELVVGDA